jgi:hypothetical protein
MERSRKNGKETREPLMVALLKMPQSVGNFKLDPRERRTFTRKEIHSRIEGRRLDHSIPARQQPHVSLALSDLSVGGLSAVTEQPLGAGERVAVFFPPQGVQRGWDAYGRVIRCRATNFGYQIALEFDPIPAAA